MLNLVSTIGAFILAAGIARRGVGRAAAEGPRAARRRAIRGTPARSSGCRKMPGEAVGRPLDSRDRQPLSAVGSAELRARRRRGPLLPAGRRRGAARDARHVDRRRDAGAVPAHSRPDVHHALVRRCSSAASSSSPPSSCWTRWPLVSAALGLAAILVWLWTGTARFPRKPDKDVGLGLTLPLYVSGRDSVGWWAMFITMLGDVHARSSSLVFGYFFYWTLRERLPAQPSPRPGCSGPQLAARAAWRLVGADGSARRWNGREPACASTPALLAGGAAAAPAAARCWPVRGSPSSIRPRHVYRRHRLGAA